MNKISENKRRRLAACWSAANSVGVAISIFIAEYSFYRGIKAGDYKLPADARQAPYLVAWLTFMMMLGAVQVLTCDALIFRVKIRHSTSRMTVGSAIGALSGMAVTVLGVFFVVYVFDFPSYFGEFHYGSEPLIGIFAFCLSGLVFGALAASQFGGGDRILP